MLFSSRTSQCFEPRDDINNFSKIDDDNGILILHETGGRTLLFDGPKSEYYCILWKQWLYKEMRESDLHIGIQTTKDAIRAFVEYCNG